MSHRIITLEHYLGPYKNHPQMQSVVLLANAERTIAVGNELCALAEADGVELEDNPATGTAISGNGNGGARPHDTAVGSAMSAHKDLNAGDRFDPKRLLMEWLLGKGWEHVLRLKIHLEHPQWTRSWVHWQTVSPKSGNVVFVPYADMEKNPPTCAALKGQKDRGIPVFPFKAAK